MFLGIGATVLTVLTSQYLSAKDKKGLLGKGLC
jgi:hypothetical protein